MKKQLQIVIPMAGEETAFKQAGYSFPKPLIDVNGKPMIQLVIENLKPECDHRFIFICKKEHYDLYSLGEIFHNLAGKNHEVIQVSATPQGAACTVLNAIDFIANDNDIMIANSDQVIDTDINKFISFARRTKGEGTIMTFESSHPKWSYVRLNQEKQVIEVVEKKVISNHATVGLYYYKQGTSFVSGATKMIEKNIRFNGFFYASLVYNELILVGKNITSWKINSRLMRSMATPEDLSKYMTYLELTQK